jgi:hypothetical protein
MPGAAWLAVPDRAVPGLADLEPQLAVCLRCRPVHAVVLAGRCRPGRRGWAPYKPLPDVVTPQSTLLRHWLAGFVGVVRFAATTGAMREQSAITACMACQASACGIVRDVGFYLLTDPG